MEGFVFKHVPKTMHRSLRVSVKQCVKIIFREVPFKVMRVKIGCTELF